MKELAAALAILGCVGCGGGGGGGGKQPHTVSLLVTNPSPPPGWTGGYEVYLLYHSCDEIPRDAGEDPWRAIGWVGLGQTVYVDDVPEGRYSFVSCQRWDQSTCRKCDEVCRLSGIPMLGRMKDCREILWNPEGEVTVTFLTCSPPELPLEAVDSPPLNDEARP